jgi:hypothetical protein
MYELFLRTLSTSLQAVMPLAVCLAWCRRHGQADALAGARWGVVAAVALTPAAGYLFQASSRQAQWEALLAWTAAALIAWFAFHMRRPISASPPLGPIALRLVFATALIVLAVRQTMEIAVSFNVAAIEVRSLEATVTISTAIVMALAAAWATALISRRLAQRTFAAAAAVFVGIFLAQTLLYAVHESAEAGLLPSSEVLHAATEPYGPDGTYGLYISQLLILGPVFAMVGSPLRSRIPGVPEWSVVVKRAAAVAVVGLLAVAWMTVLTTRGGIVTVSSVGDTTLDAEEIAAVTAAPHLMFRDTALDTDFNKLSMASLASPGATRLAAGMSCERLSFAAGRGLCLQVERGVFTTYRAVVFGEGLTAERSFKLDGMPSRTRMSPDGRLGAITVFDSQNHGYESPSASTKTTLIDMSTGETLADLEQFTTWKKGVRFRAADFNFWGVTFAADSNKFYATLRTGKTTYLVQGDVALRKFTVLHENVECPSLSPDNRLIAFKKRVGPHPADWRLYVLELATMRESPISGESRTVDDQIEWLDDARVLYTMPQIGWNTAKTDVWMAPIDGSAPAQVFLGGADSPIVVRQ